MERLIEKKAALQAKLPALEEAPEGVPGPSAPSQGARAQVEIHQPPSSSHTSLKVQNSTSPRGK